jgi:hypothetical protein
MQAMILARPRRIGNALLTIAEPTLLVSPPRTPNAMVTNAKINPVAEALFHNSLEETDLSIFDDKNRKIISYLCKLANNMASQVQVLGS